MAVKDELKSLYSLCFDDNKNYVDYFFEKKYKRNNALFIKCDEKIVSMLTLIPKKIFIRGKVFSCPYIVGACTHPDFRNRGFITKLLYDAFSVMKERGEVVTALYPFSHAFYEKSGFITVSRMTERTLNDNGKIYEIKTARADDAAALSDFYKIQTKDSGLKIYRNIRDFAEKIAETASTGKTVIAYKDNKITGYAMYDGEEIIEALGEGFFKELYGRKYYQANENGEKYAMMRILNPVKQLSEIKYPKIKKSVRMKITDNFYPENNAVIKMDIAGGKALISESSEFDYALTAEQLTLLTVGAYERESYCPPKDLTVIFPPVKSAIYDKY
jgi:predicted acetyltransferase